MDIDGSVYPDLEAPPTSLDSIPAYHAIRLWFGWDPVTGLPGLHAAAPRYMDYDRIEGRPIDPCEEEV